jgi:hypothetical protein
VGVTFGHCGNGLVRASPSVQPLLVTVGQTGRREGENIKTGAFGMMSSRVRSQESQGPGPTLHVTDFKTESTEYPLLLKVINSRIGLKTTNLKDVRKKTTQIRAASHDILLKVLYSIFLISF